MNEKCFFQYESTRSYIDTLPSFFSGVRFVTHEKCFFLSLLFVFFIDFIMLKKNVTKKLKLLQLNSQLLSIYMFD